MALWEQQIQIIRTVPDLKAIHIKDIIDSENHRESE